MNRLDKLFTEKKKGVLNVYFTAGHPNLNDTSSIIDSLDSCGVDLIEVGIPYSDPMADGETIQNSSANALKNGMNLNLLFSQITEARLLSQVPIVLMGYYNQMLQFGIEDFLKNCENCGVDGLIIPDLPMYIYRDEYQSLFESFGIKICFLITPETSDERIRLADELSTGFIYVVSKSSITGSASDIDDSQRAYFEKIKSMSLQTPQLIGFGIHDQQTYNTACANSSGAIIGSAFIRAIDQSNNLDESIKKFIKGIR